MLRIAAAAAAAFGIRAPTRKMDAAPPRSAELISVLAAAGVAAGYGF